MPIALRWLAIVLGSATAVLSPMFFVLLMSIVPLGILVWISGGILVAAKILKPTKLVQGAIFGVGLIGPILVSTLTNLNPAVLLNLLPALLLSLVFVTASGLKSMQPIFAWWAPLGCLSLSMLLVWMLYMWATHSTLF